jgi:imidazolonepropionase-like amidohydrolase
MIRSTSVVALALLIASPAVAAPPAAAIRYTQLTADRLSGALVATSAGPAIWDYDYEFNDRGRGPKTHTRIRFDGRIPVSVAISGNDYLKQPVDEHYELADHHARWWSGAEKGEAAVDAPAVYVSLDGPPIEIGLLARALLASPTGKLRLLPAGEARLERVATVTVEAGATRAVSLYFVHGLGLYPASVWLDADGEYFASLYVRSGTIREGWEKVAPRLLAIEQAEETRRARAVAEAAARRPSGGVAIVGVSLFDSVAARLLPKQTVVIAGQRIVAVGADGTVPIPASAERIDGAGKTLLPGLWDMHVHVDAQAGVTHVAAGVTTVRDLGNDIDDLAKTKRLFDEGTVVGPRLLRGGMIDGRGPFAGRTKVFADTTDEARAGVERYAKLGYEQIKIYSSLKPELVPIITAEAHRRGLRVSGHVPAFMTARDAVAAGYDEIQHANFLVLNFFFDQVKDTRGPVRFTAVAENAATLDLGSARVREFVAFLKAKDIVIDPTLTVFEEIFTARRGAVSPSYVAVASRLPTNTQRELRTGRLPVPDGHDQRYRDSFATLLKLVKALYDAGVRIVAGTDTRPGFGLHRELELYVQAGIPAPKVLQLATLGAARVMKRDGELGSISAGKLADLVLVDGDPTARIGDIRKAELVIKDGTLYSTAKLYQAINVRP